MASRATPFKSKQKNHNPNASQKRKRESTTTTTTSQNPSQQAADITFSFPSDLTTSTPLPPATIPPNSTNTNNKNQSQTTISSLTQTHTLHALNIISSTSITKKVTQTLSLLSTYPTPSNEKPPIVVFTAKSEVASKLITVVEIAKREIGGNIVGGKWFEYVFVEGKLEKLKGEKKQKRRRKGLFDRDGGEGRGDVGGDEKEDEEEEGEEEEAFEVMKTPFERVLEGREVVRKVPVMTVFLSRVRVDSLRRLYGEQTNAEPAPRSN